MSAEIDGNNGVCKPSRSVILADNGVKNVLSMLNCKYIIEQMYCFVNPKNK
jgi:hypothetical protein